MSSPKYIKVPQDISADRVTPPPMTMMMDPDGSSNGSNGRIPSTHSSQQLIPDAESTSASSSDSHTDPHHRGSRATNVGFRAITPTEWFTVIILCFVNLINYMDRFTIAGVLTDIQLEFKIGDDKAGVLQTAFVLSYMICAPIFGYLGDRYSRRWIMIAGVALWSGTTLLGSFMNSFGWFLTFRGLVGIGEASYSTIAPTIISDLFISDMRSKMLALFYFAIPVGSGFGYIIGSETARAFGSWRWALRVTPILGAIAVVLLFLTREPERGQSEGSHNLETTSYTEDLKEITRNPSFMFSTLGFTCVAFVTGALAWWGPSFMYLGLKLQPGNENLTLNDVAYKFGIVAMLAGLIGVPLGSYLAQRLRKINENADPIICTYGLFISAPLVYVSLVVARYSITWCFILVFFAEVSLNLCWSIVADILLYVVVPTRRSTAEAFQILISHMFGDAGSPYLVGVLSEGIKMVLSESSVKATEFDTSIKSYSQLSENVTTATIINDNLFEVSDENKFRALQYSLFSTSFVEILGGVFFLITAMYIIQDKLKAERAVTESQRDVEPTNRIADVVDDVNEIS